MECADIKKPLRKRSGFQGEIQPIKQQRLNRYKNCLIPLNHLLE